jgi:hypothetical protein
MVDRIVRSQPLRLLDLEASPEQSVIPLDVLLVPVEELIVGVQDCDGP